MKKLLTIGTIMLGLNAGAQTWSQELAKTAMVLWKDSFALKAGPAKWSYDQGVILKGVEGIWNATGDVRWFNYIQKSMDFYVQEDGTIKGYKKDEFNIDHINNGKLVLFLYRVTGKEKYRKAAQLLRSQLLTHPRTSEGGFWHKKVYPYQMWLDGLYMGQPFYAEYASVFGEAASFNDITRQFVLMEKNARDAKTGLLYHGWDESRQQKWADPKTGLSPNIWGRALGWFGMAMVDALDHFPKDHKGRDSIIAILNRFAKAVSSVQDSKTGLWYDVPNMPNEPKNYFEASASSMLVYTLAKGVRMGYLPSSYISAAQKGYRGIVDRFIKTENGQVNLHGTVAVSGLGGNPYRDGSFAYYMSEPVIVNDPKGMGAFINAAVEMEMIPKQIGKGKAVLLDQYFNNEWKKEGSYPYRYHYTWNDKANSGFAMLGDIFRMHGVQTKTMDVAPTAKNLKGTDIYLVVDPDTDKETEDLHSINSTSSHEVAKWVKEGGVLIIMGNDAGNTDLKGLNTLAAPYGIRFNEDNVNMVTGNQFDMGSVPVAAGNGVFKERNLYVKELSTLQLSGKAKPVVTKDGKNIIAIAPYGKGFVFAIGDPWLYNEYVDGRKLPSSFDNYGAATDLVQWAIQQTRKKK